MLGYRPCRSCRLWLWDEATGERELDRSGFPVSRPPAAKTLCEIKRQRELSRPGDSSSEGCPKGHWSDRPDLLDGEEAYIDLYRSAQATGGACLTDAERLDSFCMVLFARLAEVDSLVASQSEAEHSRAIITAIDTFRTSR